MILLVACACGGPAPSGNLTPPLVCTISKRDGNTRTVQLSMGALFEGPVDSKASVVFSDCGISPTNSYFGSPSSYAASCTGWTSLSSACRRNSGDDAKGSAVITADVLTNGPGTLTCQAELRFWDEKDAVVQPAGDVNRSVSCQIL